LKKRENESFQYPEVLIYCFVKYQTKAGTSYFLIYLSRYVDQETANDLIGFRVKLPSATFLSIRGILFLGICNNKRISYWKLENISVHRYYRRYLPFEYGPIYEFPLFILVCLSTE